MRSILFEIPNISTLNYFRRDIIILIIGFVQKEATSAKELKNFS